MHMADALISPIVGAGMIAASSGIAAYSIKKVQKDMDDKKIPFMGVLGAFVFAAQMINFQIPGTGASGHIGGGLLLAVLLGPYAGFLTMCSILLIQALFFADGGLLALGCNIFNLGFYTCFLAYPLIYKRIAGEKINQKRIFAASIIASVVGLQLGAFSVVIETLLSGKTELPFGTFVLLMQPIHLAIGVVEGVITAAVIGFVWKARPEIMEKSTYGESIGKISMRNVMAVFLIAVVLVGGVLSWFASANPDGLEWSMEKTAGTAELEAEGKIYEVLSRLQDKISFLPDYSFKTDGEDNEEVQTSEITEKWPAVSPGTSVSGIVGGFMTLALAMSIGLAISLIKRKKRKAAV
ncbi:energy-coupling factor ABC transporter permease [Acetivibrio clariflavus]|uniref:ABC-type Co2+ transport system, permease component n=1 Tax=Acetivibrio clariflavus (strain DSM 19732 / NBRC 101661 / EBR45) TaxID=720554 RepID=G8M2M4_ACECE|nr:energy-coupling factor ABC transporter permease [Acetivibrio clariflavus]AEV67098.1 ABC-type Co2+ transport system, permease component [Acetivibrio clariflavus DSM 19732]HOQ01008.1 energy-coupling factor ABC transporter permease [Acetivibrio clariflavus]HPU41081.1 energy-coupling factor ABC transporter permease [Acetivibrio clariflavus]